MLLHTNTAGGTASGTRQTMGRLTTKDMVQGRQTSHTYKTYRVQNPRLCQFTTISFWNRRLLLNWL